MQANEFVTKLKADGSEKDVCVFEGVTKQYEVISAKLSKDDKKTFALNILSMLCRNLDKVPKWKQKVDNKSLLIFSIMCAEDIESADRSQRIKTLACIFHLHKHLSKQNISPDTFMKLSYLPFDDTNELPKEHCKTYWAILVDRLTFVENLKTAKISIQRYRQKITDHIKVIIELYSTVSFCNEILPIFMKKMYTLYKERKNPELSSLYEKIFLGLLSKNDYKQKNLSENVSLDLYKRLLDCFNIIFEDALVNGVKSTAFLTAVNFSCSMFKESKEICQCIETFYKNSFCHILKDPKSEIMANFIKKIHNDCEIIDKLKYDKIMNLTYPCLAHMFNTYTENICTDVNINNDVHMKIRDECVLLIEFLMEKLTNTEQLVRCDSNCKFKSGIHDSLRLSFLLKDLISISLEKKLDILEIAQSIFRIFQNRQQLLTKLVFCANYDKYLIKSQTDTHNLAILFYKSGYYELSDNLLCMYLKTEIQIFLKNGYKNKKNLSRGFFNRAICESDMKSYERALKSAFMAVVFSDNLTSKTTDLAIDIKSKAFDGDQNLNPDLERLPYMTTLDVCRAYRRGEYGNLEPYFRTLEFSEFLRYEFSQYLKRWPSAMPISGVWTSFMNLLYRMDTEWISGEQEEYLLWSICEIIMETVCAVRVLYHERYASVLHKLLEGFDARVPKPFKFKLAYAVLLFLKSEYDIEEASAKYDWKNSTDTKDPDCIAVTRSIPQEHEAIARALQGVEYLTAIIPELEQANLQGQWVSHAMQIMQVSCIQLMHFDKIAHGLQLCHVLCKMSKIIGDISCYQNHLGLILYHAVSESKDINYLEDIQMLLDNVEKNTISTLIFICRFATYLLRCKDVGAAAKMVHFVQLRVLQMKDDELTDLVTAHLLEIQAEFFKQDPARYLSLISTVYKHYVTLKSTGTSMLRRLQSLTITYSNGRAVLRCVRTCRHLQLWRRARSAAPVALPKGAAPLLARTHAALTNPHHADSAQVKIDNRLKHILGLQPSNDQQVTSDRCDSMEYMNKNDLNMKTDILESVMDATVFKKTPHSPSSPCTEVRALRMPEFLYHHNSCACYACQNPICHLVFMQTCGLEASVHFRSKEFRIAYNYFNSTIKMFNTIEEKLNKIVEVYKIKGFEKYVIDIVKNRMFNEMYEIQIGILIEAAFLNLSQVNYKRVDEIIFDIREKICYIEDSNLNNEFMNLLATSAYLRREVKVKKTAEELALDVELANLKLSPKTDHPLPNAVTPENKITKLPDVTTVKKDFNEEDIPILKRRLKKLNLEETSPEKKDQEMKKGKQFKMPVPKVTKAVPEIITPRPSRSKPVITVSEVEKTPLPEGKSSFTTPLGRKEVSVYETPTSELFFTPMTSVKTYQNKKVITNKIVKNLESEFQTSKSELKSEDKNLKLKDRRTLKRATSPGKLEKEKKAEKSVVNTRRLRTQVNFSPEVEVKSTRSKQR